MEVRPRISGSGVESDPELPPIVEGKVEREDQVEGESSNAQELVEENLQELEGEICRRARRMESKSSETSYKIEKWTSVDNFSLWSCQMSDKLMEKGQGRALSKKKPTTMHEDNWEDLCLSACSEIRLYLSPNIQM